MPYLLTGNIGAGKTTVAEQFLRLGVPVYFADARAKALMLKKPLADSIRARFGPESYLPDGRPNRAFLANTVFADPEGLAALNALVHPAVAADAATWHATQTAPYSLQEAAIGLEIGSRDRYAGVIVVDCPEAIRRARVLARDGATAEQFAQRAARQWSDKRKAAAADYLIRNAGKQLLLPQVLQLHQTLTARARAH